MESGGPAGGWMAPMAVLLSGEGASGRRRQLQFKPHLVHGCGVTGCTHACTAGWCEHACAAAGAALAGAMAAASTQTRGGPPGAARISRGKGVRAQRQKPRCAQSLQPSPSQGSQWRCLPPGAACCLQRVKVRARASQGQSESELQGARHTHEGCACVEQSKTEEIRQPETHIASCQHVTSW
eukprot:350747-Chlamydomonas_euryale.AAC.10